MNIGLLHCYDSEAILSGQMALFFLGQECNITIGIFVINEKNTA